MLKSWLRKCVAKCDYNFRNFFAGTNPDRSYDGSYGIYRVSVYFWILFGLAFMAAVINRFSDIIKSKGGTLAVKL